MTELIHNLWQDETGQDLVEYVLIVSLVSVALITALGSFKDGLSGIFSQAISAMG